VNLGAYLDKLKIIADQTIAESGDRKPDRVPADMAVATRLRQGFGRGRQHYFFEFFREQ
jgi:hypothetical protein